MENFIITEKYFVLHFDEYPILFIGFNEKQQIVIGSFLYEDENEKLLFFYSIVSNTTAINFLNRHITYLELLKCAIDIYIVKKDYNYQVVTFDKITFENIDPELLPIGTVYSPLVDKEIIDNFQNNYLSFHTQKYFDLSMPTSIYKNDHFPYLDAEKFEKFVNVKSNNNAISYLVVVAKPIIRYRDAHKSKKYIDKKLAHV